MASVFIKFVLLFSLILPFCTACSQSLSTNTNYIYPIEEVLHIRSKQAPDSFYVIDNENNAEWGCSEEQISALKGIVEDAHKLAFAASEALKRRGSKRSAAYKKWLGGPQNRHHTYGFKNLSPTGITYACAASDEEPCYRGYAAAAAENGSNGILGNIFVLCEKVFRYPSHEKMLQAWRIGHEGVYSAGFILLHEAQHMSIVVGKSRRCIDVRNPRADVNNEVTGCYTPDCCATIRSRDKVRNAQNMAFFALEVAANPESNKLQSRGC
ncbi:hypothetical protein CSHISOI_09610 [Colletotrichum shisoi]|uniref:Lysine-specific metallo-endopeptidase domain-containing protein n=1 Tax=Colletotrichum shisoi TaxID=2078593 RepID=A0A5Q4BG04_9PEZI|nr:hypothetical protein CSHISOI_09610 [Colletotrichum shisoi]